MTGAALAAELRYAHVGAEGDIQTIYAAEAAEGHRGRHQRRSDRHGLSGEPARRRRRDWSTASRWARSRWAITTSPRSPGWCRRWRCSTRPSSTATARMRWPPPIRRHRPRCRRSTRSWSPQGVRIIGRIYRGDRQISSQLPGQDARRSGRQALPRRAAGAVGFHGQGLRRHPDAGRGGGTADGADDRRRRRPGEPADDDRRQQPQRGAVAHLDDRPHARRARRLHQRGGLAGPDRGAARPPSPRCSTTRRRNRCRWRRRARRSWSRSSRAAA